MTLAVLLTFTSLGAQLTFAKNVSSSRTSFFQSHFVGSEPVPTPIVELKRRLEELIPQRSLQESTMRPELVYTMIPHGRSLQAPSTDFSHPRVLFAFSPSPNSAGSRQDYQGLVDRIFITYSELQNKLEIISWNNFEGRFNFEEVRNYIPGPDQKQEFVPESRVLANNFTLRQACITCHQSGGPLYSDKPWSESSSSFGSHGQEKSEIAKKIEEALKSEFYLGLEVDPKNSNGKRPLTGGSIHAVVKSAHAALLNARRIVRQGCSEALICRKTFVQSVLQLAKNGYYDDSENNFFMMTGFRDRLAPLISVTSLPAHHFSYPSHTLVNFDPLAVPGPITSDINPAFPRKHIEALVAQPGRELNELMATQMLFRGYEGLGFLYENLFLIKSCDQLSLDQVFASSEFQEIVQSWNLNDSDQETKKFTPIYSSILQLLETRCIASTKGTL